MVAQQNISIYQGSSFSQRIYLNNGVPLSVQDIQTGSSPEITFTRNHAFQVNDYVQLIDIRSVPDIPDNVAQITSVTSESITIDQPINSYHKSIKSKVVKAKDLAGYTFKGQIRQKKIGDLGNLVVSVDSGSDEILLRGYNPIMVGDHILIPSAGFTEGSPGLVIQVFRAGLSSVIRVDTPATSTVSRQPISLLTKLLGSFSFSFPSSNGGVVEASLTASETESFPITYDRPNYFYDIKAQKPDNTIVPVLHGNVSIIPQITPIGAF